MNDTIKVHVVKYPNRPNLVLRYLDRDTGKQVAKTAGTADRLQAVKAAAVWESELRAGKYAKPSRMLWDDFRDYHEQHVAPGMSVAGYVNYRITFNSIERYCRPTKLADITTAKVLTFISELRKAGKAEATVMRHLRHLKAAMRWANRQGLLASVPTFDMPKRGKGGKLMRGRPLAAEEFERMLAAVPAIVDNVAAPSWEFYLKGLWDSGLRLGESLLLRWDDAPGAIVVDFSGRRPMIRIPAESQKSGRDELLPVTPEMAALLETVPPAERRGRVFKLLAADGSRFNDTRPLVSLMVSAIGEKAGVVVDERMKRGKLFRKFASCHDLRRSFGRRWSTKVMPVVLKQLMRHADIATTPRYYVGADADATADIIWTGSELGSVGDASSMAQTSKSPQSRGF